MKRQFNILKGASLIMATVLLLSACLKENDDTYFDFASVGTLVEIPLSAYVAKQSKKVQKQEYTASATPADLPVVVNIASPQPLSKDLKVVLGVNANDALAKFNTANGTNYVLLPNTAFSVADLTTNIPAGQRLGTVTFKINTAAVDKTVSNYVLPVSIVDGGGEKISNYNTVYYNIVVK
ncbi:DUF1735 domain-containing protein [Flavihumibacter sp. R14]|nr:DUF1735 domain-containing protein [Flavihumibacter soli]